MKKVALVICLALAMIISHRISAQSTIMAYPLSGIRQVLRLGYEYHVPETRMSYGAAASGYFNSTSNSYSGFGISPYVKIAINKKKIPNAWYFQPKLIFGYLKAQETYARSTSASEAHRSFNIDFFMYGIGAVFGKQWTLKNGLTFTIELGAKYVHRNIPDRFVEGGYIYDYQPGVFFLGPPVWYLGPGCIIDGNFGIGYTFPTKSKK